MKKKLLLCGLIALAACGDAGTGPGIKMSFQLVPVDRDTVVLDPAAPEAGGVPATVVTAAGSAVHVSGYFETPCTGDPVNGSAIRVGEGTIRVRIRAAERRGACPMRPDAYTYEGRIYDLAGGTYRVVVEHERDARRPDGVVLSTTVTLPS